MKRAKLLLLFCGALPAQVLPLYGQSPMEQAIAASYPLTKATADRSDIVTAGAVMTLKKDNVIMFATTASTKAALVYKDGKISPSIPTRLAAFTFTGRPATNIVQRTYVAGEKLWLIGVQAASDGVTLQFLSDPVSDVRYATSIKFPFPKGGTLTPEQVKAEIGEVISSDGAGAPATSAPPAPAEAPIVAPPPPGGDGPPANAASAGAWRIAPMAGGGTEAMIAGKEISAGRTDSAVLDVSCDAGGRSSFELRVRRKAVTNLGGTDFDCGAGPNGYRNAFLAVGSQPEENAKICDFTSDAAGPYHFQIYPSDQWLKGMVASPGSQLSVRIREDKVDNVLATFTLPSDGSQIATVMDSCFKSGDAARKKYLSTVVLSCPKAIPGKVLSGVDVLTASGKPYHSPDDADDMDDRAGQWWTLPKPTKAHPVVAKLTLECTYGTDTSSPTPSAGPAIVKRLPIPASARTCSFEDFAADCTR